MSKFSVKKSIAAVSVSLILGAASSATAVAATPVSSSFPINVNGELLPTGKRIMPTATPNSVFMNLNPHLSTRPNFLADHAVDTALSPDGKTLLVLTSGYNRNNDASGIQVAAESNEYVFVFDISGPAPVQKQAIQVPNTFNGIAWNPQPNVNEFYVSGGVNDNVHVYTYNGSAWAEAATGSPIALGHTAGVGGGVKPMAAGLSVNASGTQLLVVNYFNDSVSLIDLASRTKVGELDLRPGKNGQPAGTPGGTYPIAVAFKGNAKAYVSSQRDRELVVLSVSGTQISIQKRISTEGQPNKMTLNQAQDRLYVASDNSDTVLIVNTVNDTIAEEILTTAPKGAFTDAEHYKGANPNNVALSPDGKTLYVTNGGTNSVAVIQLGQSGQPSQVVGLIPTGWYPNAVSVNPNGNVLYVVNGKSVPGPDTQACKDSTVVLHSTSPSYATCNGKNQYVWQLEKAGFLTLPIPSGSDLARLTWQVAFNNSFAAPQVRAPWKSTMDFLRSHIKHVIYVVKENRTYDQIHGADLQGNGDPTLAILAPYAPNHRAFASQFVRLDNFYDSGETSGVGWNWSTGARTNDHIEKTQPPNYAGRGLSYDWEGDNRNVPVSLSQSDRAALGFTDPDVLAGSADVAAPDSRDDDAGKGYLWDAALHAGLTLRNYGFFVNNLPNSSIVPDPFNQNIKQARAAKQVLDPYTDPYYRGYDQRNSDFYLFKEWEREFDGYVNQGNLPNLSLVRISHDHFGSFTSAKFGVNTIARQMSDDDYAFGRIVEKVAKSPYKNDTLIFVLEDDAQDGPDHVDAHRSIAYVVGPYVKRGALVSTRYTTVSMVRTIEEVLGLPPLGINDGLTAPMADVFNENQASWDYTAVIPSELCSTGLQENGQPLCAGNSRVIASAESTPCPGAPKRDAAYWEEAMEGQEFEVEDKLDTSAFNQALWAGLKGEDVPYPVVRDGRDLRANREELLKNYRIQQQ
jgi:DNA-binding beta-propeller fold protein YncE